MEKICDHEWESFQRQYNKFDKIIREYECCMFCGTVRQTIGTPVEKEMSLDEALAEFKKTSISEASEHQLRAFSYQRHNLIRAKFLTGRLDIQQYEQGRINQAIELIQVAPKRKLMIDNDCLDAFAEIEPSCLPPEVRR